MRRLYYLPDVGTTYVIPRSEYQIARLVSRKRPNGAKVGLRMERMERAPLPALHSIAHGRGYRSWRIKRMRTPTHTRR